jgi:hypothetical protein
VVADGEQMNKKKILVVGCSFVEDCGFNEDNQLKFHWPKLLSDYYKCDLFNAGIGGSSNDEIFYRTIQLITESWFDLVVVMWSDLGRKWAYIEENNVDDFTILNNGDIKGFVTNKDIVNQYAKLHYTYFNNQYINLKTWLSQIIMLQTYCKHHNQPIIFAKGFENHVIDFNLVEYCNGFINIDPIKYMFDFNNRPDDYINLKINDIKRLMSQIDQASWINFNTPSFLTNAVDLADDQKHPGPISNKKFYQELVDFCDKYSILKIISKY